MLVVSIAISCGGTAGEKTMPASSCVRDTDCPSPQGCVVGRCMFPRIPSPAWVLEIAPPIDVATSNAMPALTEFATIPPGSPTVPPSFTVDEQTVVMVTVIYAANAAIPTNAHLLLSVPSGIPGRPDLTLEVPVSADPAGTGIEGVPSRKIGQTGTLTVAPLSSDGAKAPPRPFPVTLNASLRIDVKADLAIHGKLLDPFGGVLSDTFVARAFQQGRAVSNAPTVDEMDGSFLLLVPANVAATPFVVDLDPQASAGPNAWFRSNPIQLTDNVTLPTFNMAPYLTAGNQFRVMVQGDDAGMPVVPGALVRALTVIPPASTTQPDIGSTNFLRDVVTDNDGAANTTLVPAGNANANRIYEIAVIPPVGSSYATTCFPQQPVGSGTTSPAPPANLPTIVLPRRPVLSGTLRSATGAPVANATVTATPTADPIASCSMTMTRASPGSTLTDDVGRFTLRLDPGTYQLDYNPPAGSAVPRLSERAPFVISADVSSRRLATGSHVCRRHRGWTRRPHAARRAPPSGSSSPGVLPASIASPPPG